MKSAGEFAKNILGKDDVTEAKAINGAMVVAVQSDSERTLTFSNSNWRVGLFRRLDERKTLLVFVPVDLSEVIDDN